MINATAIQKAKDHFGRLLEDQMLRMERINLHLIGLITARSRRSKLGYCQETESALISPPKPNVSFALFSRTS